MKLLLGLLIIFMSVVISGVAAYFSVFGLMALFAAAALPVAIMGIVLEAGKLLMASVLHANWNNKNFKWPLKAFLGICIALLMIINALGVYGYLSRGHLEQEAPRANIELQLAQLENQKKSILDENQRINDKINLLDKSIETFLKNDKATQGEAARNKQKAERAEFEKQIKENLNKISKINEEILPLQQQNATVEAKLGPIKYVASLFGSTDPEEAVRIVIILLMIAFDPFAVAMVITGSIILSEHFQRKEKKIDNKSIKEFTDKIELLENKIQEQLNEIELEKTSKSNIELEKNELQIKINHYQDKINELTIDKESTTELSEINLNNLKLEMSSLSDKIQEYEKSISEKNNTIQILENQVSRMNSVTLLQELQSMDVNTRKEQIIQILENNPNVVEEIVTIAKEISITPGGDRISKGKY